jgi:hypothetical protein
MSRYLIADEIDHAGFAGSFREPIVQDPLLGALGRARAGLRSTSTDEVDQVFDFCRQFPRDQWPPEVAQFISGIERGRGRMKPGGRRIQARMAAWDRFWSDPNFGFVGPVCELTVQDYLLAGLFNARAGLRRKSIDEVKELFDKCRQFPRDQWPPEVERFIRRIERRRGRLRRGSGRLRSRMEDSNRFWRSPNRIAAHFASIYVKELRGAQGKSKKRGPYKIEASGGVRKTISNEALPQTDEHVPVGRRSP